MNYIEEYANFLGKFIRANNNVKVVFDCSNGPAGLVLEALIRGNTSITPTIINDELDGDFPAHGPSPLVAGALDDLRKTVIEQGADFGVIFDGDADRVMFMDERGELLDTYQVFRLIQKYFTPPFVVDVRALAAFVMPGEGVIESKAGRLFLWKTMHKHQATFGAERTGHFFFKDFNYLDSAILASIHVINLVSEIKGSGHTLSEAAKDLSKVIYPPEIILEVKDVSLAVRKVRDHYVSKGYSVSDLDGVTVQGEDFAFNLRAAATEPVAKLNIAAKDQTKIEECIAEIKQVVF